MTISPKQAAVRVMARAPIYRVLPPGAVRTYAALKYHGEHSGQTDIARFVRSLGSVPGRHLSTALVAARAAFRAGQDDLLADILATLDRRFPEAPEVHLLTAELHAFSGRYDQALSCAERARLLQPSATAALARIIQLSYRVHEREVADGVAVAAVRRFPRNARVLWAVCKSCDSTAQFERIHEAWNDSVTEPADLLHAVRQLGLAAARTRQVETAVELYRRAIRLIHRSDRRPEEVAETTLHGRGAWSAIEDLHHALDNAGIPYFFAAGTALGLIREGRPLNADGDIDVGIHQDHWNRDTLINLFTHHPKFDLDLHPQTTKVGLRHRGGSPIDVFRFYQQNDKIWHDGVFVRWHNTPFQVTRRNIGNLHLPIPEDADRYLTENYGDWQTPNPAFDAFTNDAPNLEVTWPEYQQLHYLRRAYKRMMVRDVAATQQDLQRAGESDLATKIGAGS